MTKEKGISQIKAEQMIESIGEWLANSAQGSDLVNGESFGRVQQDLAIDFSQVLLDSVGLPIKPLFQIARSLTQEPEADVQVVTSICLH